MKFYVPNNSNYACIVVYDKDTIRAYTNTPSYNTTINYTDLYVNSHYMSKNGQQTFSQYSTLPTCINNDYITDNVFYRNDINDIMCTFFIILIICFYFPFRIISRMFGRWLKI